jgi:hypothetical protein
VPVNLPEFNTPNADDFLTELMRLPREQQLRLLRRVSQSAPPGLADQMGAPADRITILRHRLAALLATPAADPRTLFAPATEPPTEDET